MNEVSKDYLNELILARQANAVIPREGFLAYDECSNHRIAADNRTNDMRVEEFENQDEAIARLNDEFEVFGNEKIYNLE